MRSEVLELKNHHHKTKYKETTHHWHGDAIRSSGIKKPSSYEVDGSGNPTFSEVADQHRAKVIAAYHENKRYYDLLKAMNSNS